MQVRLQVLQPSLMGPGCHGRLCSLFMDPLRLAAPTVCAPRASAKDAFRVCKARRQQSVRGAQQSVVLDMQIS